MKQFYIFFKILGCIAIILLSCQPQAFAQKNEQDRIDSLLGKLSGAKEDSDAVALYNSLSYAYHNIDPDEGINYGKLGLDISLKLKWKAGEAMSDNNLGINYKAKSDYPAALSWYMSALSINEALGNKKSMASNLGNIGIIYQNRNDYKKALEYQERALKINKELDNKKGIATNLDNMGNIYQHQNNNAQALLCLVGALKIKEEIGDKNDIAACLGNIGTYYASINDFAKALEYDFKSLQINAGAGNKNGRAVNLGNIGEIYYIIASRPQGVVKPNNLISANRDANLRKAISYLNDAIAASRETGFLRGVMKFNKTLSKAYSMGGNDKKALDAFKEYANLHDSVFSTDNSQQIKQIENKHDKELKDKDIQIKKLDLARRETRAYVFLAGIAILLVVIFFIVMERKKSEKLLLNILPGQIADRLKKKEHPIADHFKNVSIMFIDMAGFTEFAEARHPKETVSVLNDIFTHFDSLAEKHGLEKIKTIGDCYMAVSGVPTARADHAIQAAAMALEIRETMKGYAAKDGTSIHFRIGLDCGPVVAGVIGTKKFIYDLWGDAVNTASRMETTGIAGEIHCTDNFKNEVQATDNEQTLTITFTNRGMVEVKSKGQMQTWLIS